MLNSYIVSASIKNINVNNLREGVLVTFRHLTPKDVSGESIQLTSTWWLNLCLAQNLNLNSSMFAGRRQSALRLLGFLSKQWVGYCISDRHQRGIRKISEGHTGSFECNNKHASSLSLLDGRGGWNHEGCEAHSVSPSQTSCRCNHLTHFGVLLVSTYPKSVQRNCRDVLQRHWSSLWGLHPQSVSGEPDLLPSLISGCIQRSHKWCRQPHLDAALLYGLWHFLCLSEYHAAHLSCFWVSGFKIHVYIYPILTGYVHLSRPRSAVTGCWGQRLRSTRSCVQLQAVWPNFNPCVTFTTADRAIFTCACLGHTTAVFFKKKIKKKNDNLTPSQLQCNLLQSDTPEHRNLETFFF